MTFEQTAVFAILAVTMTFFIWGRWRYDLVAVLALLAAVFSGVVTPEHAFFGFGHPAVITVAAVLIISKALQRSGVVDLLVSFLAPTRRNVTLQISAAGGLAVVFSAFMNNVGALALMLPVTLKNALKAGRSPALVLMPLSFASLLGGLITLIGTPPNIVIATYRESIAGAPFEMFDFTPVGLAVALAGMVFISLIGWRLIPQHRRGDGDGDDNRFHIEAYVTEVQVPEESPLIGTRVRELEKLCENEATVMSIIRGKRRLLAPSGLERLNLDDILLLEGDPVTLKPIVDGVKLVQLGSHDIVEEELRSDDVDLVEAVVMPNATVEGRSMRGMKMHENYGINLLAVARRDLPPKTRLGAIRFKTGDVLLLQGDRAIMRDVLPVLGCLPLAKRELVVGARRRALLPTGIFAAAILMAAFGAVPIQIAFVAAVVLLILTNTIGLRDLYDSIEWPVIVLLGALIPVGEALQVTGGTALIAGWIISLAGEIPLWTMLAVVLIASMLLSDLVHNTPTAVLMAPIAVAVAEGLDQPIDAFLMAVAVGAASPYLTPVGHQSNTLVMGPGGYHFGDYWRLGLPLDLVILSVAVPMIMWVWM